MNRLICCLLLLCCCKFSFSQSISTQGFNPIYFESHNADYTIYSSVGELCITNNNNINEGFLQNLLSPKYEIGEQRTFSVFPNPSNNTLLIFQETNYTEMSIYNLLGILLITQEISDGLSQIDIMHLIPATYFIKLTAPSVDSEIVEFIKI